MEIFVEKDRQNPLLKRREIYFRLKYEEEGATPSRKDVRQKIAGLFNANLDTVIIDYIKPEFGKCEAFCYAKIYDSVEDLHAIEEDHIIKRNFGKSEGEGEEGEGEEE
ncbi:30S ribosomal protein S24e [Archaeoglobus veneficus]|uniref:Small ribosomal subunit protein eS24 n=1 Tax=Archaeoglobus veneficus (strain DSM 11195 / SNP6) TaxID=693661 RepID=F2KS24_ARCVS|nr:30S ribosomal protein S24e [Archaeoglobus veneficus]AEA46865.1 30S ribosomal protein S24e [Archaeoglobus veneficus SNP6]